MKSENNYRELVIIIAEDDMGHAELIREGLRDSGICNSILHFLNGEEVWNFLSDQENSLHRDISNSYLLLLDINMPRLDGIEVLRRLKGNDSLKDIPVVMLTTTDEPREVEQCYKLGCNFYITKPVDFSRFSETLRRLGLFIQIVKV